jgi:serpin B
MRNVLVTLAALAILWFGINLVTRQASVPASSGEQNLPLPPSEELINVDVIETKPPVELPEDLKTLSADNTKFAFDLYTILKQEEGNLFYSPYSISTALAMAYAGAKGETEKEMAATLHFALPQDKLHQAFATLADSFEAREGLELSVANALWGQQNYAFLPGFLKTLEDGYGSSLKTLNFADTQGSRQVINDWVAEQTKDRIKDIIPDGILNEDTRLVLANAIYFNATWQIPFDVAQTKEETFTLLDKREIKAPMMFQRTSAGYTKAEGYQVLSLPYNGDMSLLAILPDAGQFEKIESMLSADFLNQLQPFKQDVILKMPKFEFEKSIELVKPMQDLGMATAFKSFDSERPDENCGITLRPEFANFSGIDETYCLFVSAIFHKAFVKVEEKGTEAAAATVGVVGVTGVSVPLLPIELTINRPFIFLIRDNYTGSILFVGRVFNPLS